MRMHQKLWRKYQRLTKIPSVRLIVWRVIQRVNRGRKNQPHPRNQRLTNDISAGRYLLKRDKQQSPCIAIFSICPPLLRGNISSISSNHPQVESVHGRVTGLGLVSSRVRCNGVQRFLISSIPVKIQRFCEYPNLTPSFLLINTDKVFLHEVLIFSFAVHLIFLSQQSGNCFYVHIYISVSLLENYWIQNPGCHSGKQDQSRQRPDEKSKLIQNAHRSQFQW
mmetsp:Transcript_37900/g.91900  ORF Transcript_37900/g.91900 Transcript_37900/m.91900 type:complete len:222 (-) Transcript_37900:548-1213(-)